MTTRTSNQASTQNPFSSLSAPVAFASKGHFSANPFEVSELPATEPGQAGPTGYALAASGPAVDPAEVELAAVAAVEVTVMWGTNVLAVHHLTPPRSYFVGEAQTAELKCDFLVPAEKLGFTSAPLVVVEAGRTYAVVLPGATGSIEIPGQARMTIDEAAAAGALEPCLVGGVAGARRVLLQAASRVRTEIGGLTFQVGSVAAGRRLRRSVLGAASLTGMLFAGLSLVAHVSLLGGMAFFRPSLEGADDASERLEREVLMQQMLKASADKEIEPVKEETQAPSEGAQGGEGARAKGPSGAAGSDLSKATGMKYAIAGRKDNPDPHMSREAARVEASNFGLIALLQAGVAGDSGPTAPWGRDTAEGRDALSANGSLWGNAIGENAGTGGLDLSGIGSGANGLYEGIGFDTKGIGRGKGKGDGPGFGDSHGRPTGEHVVKQMKVWTSNPTVSGRIPAEVIQRIVRQNFGRFKMCYTDGLRNNPNLQGRVSVRFVIDRSGRVANVGNGGSDLPDSSVVSCVVRSFSGLSFPEPEGGIVTVTYPITFSPGSLG
jgi:hypothetical protein